MNGKANRKVGRGRLAIRIRRRPRSRWPRHVQAIQSPQHRRVPLQPQGRATGVTWAMRGQQPYMAKLMSTFIDCDKMVGGQFEEGLAKLKALAER